MNVKKVCSGDAVASSLGAVQGVSWLCGRVGARLYLAVHPAGPFPPVGYAVRRHLLLCEL